LNFVATDFCSSKVRGMDTLKSVLVAYSKANDKFGGANVRRVVLNSPGLEAAAIAIAVSKCPGQL
jgi:hypothetical protein